MACCDGVDKLDEWDISLAEKLAEDPSTQKTFEDTLYHHVGFHCFSPYLQADVDSSRQPQSDARWLVQWYKLISNKDTVALLAHVFGDPKHLAAELMTAMLATIQMRNSQIRWMLSHVRTTRESVTMPVQMRPHRTKEVNMCCRGNRYGHWRRVLRLVLLLRCWSSAIWMWMWQTYTASSRRSQYQPANVERQTHLSQCLICESSTSMISVSALRSVIKPTAREVGDLV